MHRDEGVDGSPSVFEVYFRRGTAVSGAFLLRRKKPHIVTVASPALAGLIYPFSTFDPLLSIVLSMVQTRAQKTRNLPPI